MIAATAKVWFLILWVGASPAGPYGPYTHSRCMKLGASEVHWLHQHDYKHTRAECAK